MSSDEQGLRLLPPSPDKCQACAVNHEPEQPHNQQSLYWQYWFYLRNGRWPRWSDAMAHCTPEIQGHWQRGLKEMFGIDVELGAGR